MNQYHDRGGPEGIPLSAVFRQLDDFPPVGSEEYDPAATITQVIAASKGDGTTVVENDLTVIEARERILRLRGTLLEQLARRRASAAIAAFAALLGIGVIAAVTVTLVHNLPGLVLAGIGVGAVLLANAVVLIHRTTTRAISSDHERLLNQDRITSEQADLLTAQPDRQSPHGQLAPISVPDEDHSWMEEAPSRPRGRRGTSVFGILTGTGTAALAGLFYLAVQKGSEIALIVLASGASTLLMSYLVLIATAVFSSSTSRSHRALSVLDMLLHGRHARYVKENRSR